MQDMHIGASVLVVMTIREKVKGKGVWSHL